MRTVFRTSKLFLIPLLIFMTLVLLGSFSSNLWPDEAETAFFARTVLQKGIPYGFDGVNISFISNGALLGDDLINRASPWMQFYITSFSFKLFGESAFTARLPFMLFSVGVLFLIYKIAFELTKDEFIALLASFLASVSVSLILFSFQARYYSLIMFGGCAFLLMALKIIDSSKMKLHGLTPAVSANSRVPRVRLEPELSQTTDISPWFYEGLIRFKIGLFLAGLFLLFSNYFTYLSFTPAVFLSFLALIKIRDKSKLRPFVTTFLLTQLPAIILFFTWHAFFKGAETNLTLVPFSLGKVLTAFPAWLFQSSGVFNENNSFPYIFLLPLFIIFYVSRQKLFKVSYLVLPFLIILFYFLILSTVGTIFDIKYVFLYNSRYNVVLIPVMLILVAGIFKHIYSFNKYLFGILIALFVFTNSLTMMGFQSYLLNYISEVTNPYQTSDEAVAEYLKAHALPGDKALVNIERSHDPLIFLLGEKIAFVNRFSTPHASLIKQNPDLPRYLFSYQDNPDWIILYSKTQPFTSKYNFDMREIVPIGRNKNYDLKNDYTETILPIFYGSDVKRPEIEWREFKKVHPGYDEQVFIYQRKKPAS